MTPTETPQTFHNFPQHINNIILFQMDFLQII